MNIINCRFCKNPSDFICLCSGKSDYLCYVHSKIHFLHDELKFIPNKQSLNNSRQVIEILKSKQQELKSLLVTCQHIKEKCIQDISSSYLRIEDLLNSSIEDLSNARNLISKLVENSQINYITAYCLLFKQNLPLIGNLFETFRDNYTNAEKAIKKLFIFKSYTRNLGSSFQLAHYDKEFNDREKERLKLKLRMKNHKKANNDTSYYYQLLKANGVKRGLAYNNIDYNENTDFKLESENIFSLYSDRVLSYGVQDSQFSNSQFDYLIQSIANYKRILYLRLENMATNEYQSERVSLALINIKDLRSLRVSNNCLCDQGAINIFNTIKRFDKLKTFELQNNYISHEAISVFSNVLPNLSKLMDLNLSFNLIGVQGAKYLRPALQKLMVLEELRISNCNLQTEGAIEIMIGVMFLPHLCILDISVNQMYDEGGLFVSESLVHMKSLNKLIIDDNLSNETIESIVSTSNQICKVICKGEITRKVVKQCRN